MGRGQSTQQAVQAVTRGAVSETQEKILDIIKDEGMAPVSYMKSTGLKPAALRKELEKLEAMGKVVRVFNAHGEQTPWWYQKARKAPAEFEMPELSKGQIWDWGDPQQRLWLEVLGGTNEYGLIRVSVKAGTHNSETIFLPPHYFDRILYPRRQGEVTGFSAGFACDCHGVCTDNMVKTDKCCALCMTPLNRI
jgi:hypothetical protein